MTPERQAEIEALGSLSNEVQNNPNAIFKFVCEAKRGIRELSAELTTARQRAGEAEELLRVTDFVDSGFCPHCHQDELRGITDAYNDYDDEEHGHIQVYHCNNCGAAWAGDPNQWVDLTKRAEAAEAQLQRANERIARLEECLGIYSTQPRG